MNYLYNKFVHNLLNKFETNKKDNNNNKLIQTMNKNIVDKK